MKNIKTTKGDVILRDITLKDNREARELAWVNGSFNDQVYISVLYSKISDKDDKFLESLSGADDVKLSEAIQEMVKEMQFEGDDIKKS